MFHLFLAFLHNSSAFFVSFRFFVPFFILSFLPELSNLLIPLFLPSFSFPHTLLFFFPSSFISFLFPLLSLYLSIYLHVYLFIYLSFLYFIPVLPSCLPICLTLFFPPQDLRTAGATHRPFPKLHPAVPGAGLLRVPGGEPLVGRLQLYPVAGQGGHHRCHSSPGPGVCFCYLVISFLCESCA